MKLSTETLIKIGLAVLLLICLFQMPYGYYQLIRYVALVGFSVLAYYEFERKNIPVGILFIGAAFLFQPVVKIPLGRDVWMIVDVVLAIGLIVSLFLKKNK
jgi:hypothetical protein